MAYNWMLCKKQSLYFVLLNYDQTKVSALDKNANGAEIKRRTEKNRKWSRRELIQFVGFFKNTQQRDFFLGKEKLKDLIGRKLVESFDFGQLLNREAAAATLDVRNKLRRGVAERIGNVTLSESGLLTKRFPLVAVDPSTGLICFSVCFAVHATGVSHPVEPC